MHLDAKKLDNTIVKGNTVENDAKAKAMIFLLHHVEDSLELQFLTIKDPADLWDKLAERFDHLKLVNLPKARHEWLNLRLQDFKSVSDYNSEMFRITSQLELCGEDIKDSDMIEKTFTTFHADHTILQQQYRAKGFTKYSELIIYMLTAEQNNELLLQNHVTRPTGSNAFPEANASNCAVPVANATQQFNAGRGRGRARNNNHGRGRGRGRGPGRGRGRNQNQRYEPYRNQWRRQDVRDICHRCGMEGHWSRTCRTGEHLVRLYQDSLKGKGKAVETNHVNDQPGDINALPPLQIEASNSHEQFAPTLEVSDYFNDID